MVGTYLVRFPRGGALDLSRAASEKLPCLVTLTLSPNFVYLGVDGDMRGLLVAENGARFHGGFVSTPVAETRILGGSGR